MRKVIVTGSNGLLGRHVVNYLLKMTNMEVVGVQKQPVGPEDNWDRYSVHQHDLIEPLQVNRTLADADALINCASLTDVAQSLKAPKWFILDNTEIALNVMEYARTVSLQKVIHVSTGEVYGPQPRTLDAWEFNAIKPNNPYAASKAAQEAIVMAYAKSYGIPAVVTNTQNLFGEWQSFTKFIPMVVRKILNEETVTIHGAADGNVGKRKWLYAGDHASALLFLLLRKDLPNDKFNIVGDIEIDHLGLAKMISSILGKELKYNFVHQGLRPGHDSRFALSGELMRDMGWKPPNDFIDVLNQTVQWNVKQITSA